MGTKTVPSDDALEVELAALRARAYGADADIDDDPEALGRLAELEALHAAGVRASAAAQSVASDSSETLTADDRGSDGAHAASASSEAERATPKGILARGRSLLSRARRTRAVPFILGAVATVCVVLAVVVVQAWNSQRADAVLAATSTRPQAYVFRLTDYARPLLIDKSTLRTYETYRGVELWSAQSVVGNSCLLAMERSSDRLLAAGCVPPGADPIIEIYNVPIYWRDRWHEGLPTGTVVRFIQHDDTVSVWLYPGTSPD